MSKDKEPENGQDTATPFKDKNVFRIMDGGVKEGPATQPAEETIPQNPYRITTVNGKEYYAEGFLLFTAQHVAVMRDTGEGALPILVVPLGMVDNAQIVDPSEATVEMPF